MPWIAFVDEQVADALEEINNENSETSESIFPEHEFLNTCLKLGLRIEDLKHLTYVDILKMFIVTIKEQKQENEEEATQEQIDDIVARM